METFEIRLLVRKKKRKRRKVDSFHSLCTRGAMYLLEIVHSHFPRMLFCWPPSIQHNDDLPGKHERLGKGSLSKLQLAEPALTAFEHTHVKDYLQKPIQLSAWFPKPLVISPIR